MVEETPMFLFNNWYVAAFSTAVTREPLARMICGLPVVLYRTETGDVVALEDRCIHRGVPLSLGGTCEGDTIQCPYHALRFDPSGTCVGGPGAIAIPATARILRYEVVEKGGMIWIWPSQAEPDHALLDVPEYLHGTDWTTQEILLEINADWQMLNDNLLDLTHLGVVHARTIGGNPDQHSAAQMKTVKNGDRGVLVTRQLPNSDPPPQYLAARAFAGKIDRWMEIDFQPGVIQIWSGGADAGTGAFEGQREHGINLRGFHGVTPATDRSLYYHFSQNFDFAVDDTLAAKLYQGALTTLLEDVDVLNAQQKRLDQTPDRPLIDLASDAGGIQARRIVNRLIAAEQRAMAVAC
jgi:phenylpropionate dioxygenase-like ring-hydroxylating dioxygenase large terminal subunit